MRLTPHQRRVLASDLICWSDTTGHAWAYSMDDITEGDSFDTRPSTIEKLQALRLIEFVQKANGVHQYRPTKPVPE